MDAQINNYENNRESIISSTSADGASYLLGKSIFTVVIGTNDFINNNFSPLQSDADEVLSAEMYVELMISKFRHQLLVIHL